MSSQDPQEENMNVDMEPDIEIREVNEPLNYNTQRSPVWTYFKLCTKEFRKAICNTCSAVLKLPTSTTSPMLKHLLTKHPDLYSKCLEVRRKRKKIEDNSGVDESSKHLKLEPPSKAELDQLCMEMIAIDLKPFSCVEDKGFRRLLKRLDNTYDPPSRTTCSRHLCPELYNETKKKLMDELKNDLSTGLMSLSFTTDGWKSRSGHHYLSLTVHYMTVSFELKNIMLGMRQFEERHTAVNIKMKLEDMMSEWGLLDLPNMPIFFTTDNAANITSAIRCGGWYHIYCIAHTLQLSIGDAQKHTDGIGELLSKARRIATHFHHSDPARRDLENAQKILSDEPPLKLIQMVKTRWNSEFDMLERMKRLQKPLSDVLSNCTKIHGLSGTDWKQITDVINVMDPFNEATKISCSSTYPTLSMVEPILNGIKTALENLDFTDEFNNDFDNFDRESNSDDPDKTNDNSRETDSLDDSNYMPATYENDFDKPLAYNYSKNLIQSLNVRFGEVEIDTIHLKCSFLDPRYRDYLFPNERTKERIKKEIKDEILEYKLSEEVYHVESESIPESAGVKPTKFWDFMKQRRTNKEESATIRIEKDIDQELMQYLYLAEIDPWDDPLLWWRKESSKLPLLSLMARRYLPIPPTSVESERLFSTAGDIVTEKRSSLSPDNVARLLFLHRN